MGKPRIFDGCCSAGGAAKGYHNAGFDVVGVDIKPQPHYPYPFILGDIITILAAMLYSNKKYLASDGKEYGLNDFDAFHISPPCQKFSTIAKYKKVTHLYPNLINPARPLLKETGKPYIIENVPGAPLENPFLLCGSMFLLNVRKHRLFETSFYVPTQSCYHSHPCQKNLQAVYGHSGGSSKRDGKKFGNVDDWALAMEINWMTGHELAEAIPPAYTEYIGLHLQAVLP